MLEVIHVLTQLLRILIMDTLFAVYLVNIGSNHIPLTIIGPTDRANTCI